MKIESSLPRKQRQALYAAPLHLKRKRLSSHLSKELKKKMALRALGVRVNDTVKVVRGKFKGKTGKINKVDYIKGRLFIEGLTRKKADGTEIQMPLNNSNVILIDLERGDSRRLRSKTKAKIKTEEKKPEAKKEKAGKKEEKEKTRKKEEEKKG